MKAYYYITSTCILEGLSLEPNFKDPQASWAALADLLVSDEAHPDLYFHLVLVAAWVAHRSTLVSLVAPRKRWAS